jgi:hypothetical protein
MKPRYRGGTLGLDVPRVEQPDDVTCGPTCLAAVYRYFGRECTVEEVIREIRRNPDGGTMAVYLGIAALEQGYKAVLYTYNLRVFDPTWASFDRDELVRKLRKRRRFVRSKRLRRVISAYADFLELGGKVEFRELETDLLAGILRRHRPILTGLSATYLYKAPRERRNEYDDVKGDPVGHFVVVSGYDAAEDRFLVRDPSRQIPFSDTGTYSVESTRLFSAILLGDVTYDAVLLEIWPRR